MHYLPIREDNVPCVRNLFFFGNSFIFTFAFQTGIAYYLVSFQEAHQTSIAYYLMSFQEASRICVHVSGSTRSAISQVFLLLVSKLWTFNGVSHQNTDALGSVCALGVGGAGIMAACSEA